MIDLKENISLKNHVYRRSEAAEEIIDKYFPVLDDGFVALKDYMGNDYAIERAARISYGGGTRKTSDTRNLLRYLIRHKHTSPFEQVELAFHIRLPMDAHRQLVRHRTANLNEYSTRYSVAIDSQQKTRPDQWRLQSKNNKQGSSGFVENWPQSYINIGVNQAIKPGNYLTECEDEFHKKANQLYNARLEFGIAREQARKDLPLSTYTEAYWKCDLHNIFHFLRLRCDSHAQLEIRSYANVIAGMVKRVAPLAFEAWIDYSFCADNLTRLDKLTFDYYIDRCQNYTAVASHEEATNNYAEGIGMSKREIEEFWKKIQPMEIPNFDLDLNQVREFKNVKTIENTV